MAVKLHRCSVKWAKFGAHPCWKVQKALDEQGVEFEDGHVYREESTDMAARIRAGKLFDS